MWLLTTSFCYSGLINLGLIFLTGYHGDPVRCDPLPILCHNIKGHKNYNSSTLMYPTLILIKTSCSLIHNAQPRLFETLKCFITSNLAKGSPMVISGSPSFRHMQISPIFTLYFSEAHNSQKTTTLLLLVL